jgi:hypothetical protein
MYLGVLCEGILVFYDHPFAQTRLRRRLMMIRTNHLKNPLKRLFAISLLLVCVASWAIAKTPPPAPPSHATDEEGKPADASPPAHGTEPEGEDSKPRYQLAKPLNGFYDLNLLRAARRVRNYRYPLHKITAKVHSDRLIELTLNCTIELGSETGMAEMAKRELYIIDDLRNLIAEYDPLTLLEPAGKRQLKSEMIGTIHQQLKTARVRRIYFTQFRLRVSGR